MGNIAAGVFLRLLRERAKLSQRAAARLIQADEKSIQLWETGQRDPGARRLAQYIQRLAGPSALVMDLLADDEATPEDAHDRYELWVGGGLPTQPPAAASDLTRAQLLVALRRLSLDDLIILLVENERAGR